jgi:Holliday junction resolvase RusA-like endonuclease
MGTTMKYRIISPTVITLLRKGKPPRKVPLNLNFYRNAHHYTLNRAKTQYTFMMRKILKGIVLNPPITLSFRYYKPTRRKTDKANVLSIVEKFFCDSMISAGCITDDDDTIILEQRYLPTIYDKGNGRVEIVIREVGD